MDPARSSGPEEFALRDVLPIMSVTILKVVNGYEKFSDISAWEPTSYQMILFLMLF